MSPTTIPLSDLYGHSRLLRFLYGGLGRALTVPGACLLWAVLSAGLFAGLCWRQGTLFPDAAPGKMSLLEDTTALSYFSADASAHPTRSNA